MGTSLAVIGDSTYAPSLHVLEEDQFDGAQEFGNRLSELLKGKFGSPSQSAESDAEVELNAEAPQGDAGPRHMRTMDGFIRLLHQPQRIRGFYLASQLREIGDEIRRSIRRISENRSNEEMGDSFTRATWDRAMAILVRASNDYWDQHYDLPTCPSIRLGSDGDIDLMWNKDGRRLMINIPSDVDWPITYLGVDESNENRATKGKIDPRDPNTWMLEWLEQ